ncbi:MAG: hydroxyethylthiazole kinase [Chloroflexus sp.]|uniref:hydroxyethylthiazole kinase n=1 Tax=Chloroflexus sp. TaxID=1904827 RepID=UPI0021DD7B6B|nr:hydroxyethylthiazole kinase [Chloroflexus sp.]GIV87629.1 MAG: hydroxyethylthiazole kinase [Chloroflexus sp.]
MTFNDRIAELRDRVRQQRPLIHHITNFVVMNDTANVTLHIGGLPVMAHDREEVAEMVAAAGALVLNVGTLSPDWIEAMIIAGKRANELGIPIVLDPVGAGATSLRTSSNRRLLETLQVAVIRGNSGEIGALAGMGGVVKGVEAVVEADDPLAAAQALARQYHTVVAVTGRRDLVTDGSRVLAVDNGHEWLKTLTGTGCSATTVIAAFTAVERDYLFAAAAGLACFGLAAELAAPQARGPASFKVAFYDAIYHLAADQIRAGARVVDLSTEQSKAVAQS